MVKVIKNIITGCKDCPERGTNGDNDRGMYPFICLAAQKKMMGAFDNEIPKWCPLEDLIE